MTMTEIRPLNPGGATRRGLSTVEAGVGQAVITSASLVHRDARPVVPPHVEYSLTARGGELAERMVPLMDWIADHAPAIVGDAEAAATR